MFKSWCALRASFGESARASRITANSVNPVIRRLHINAIRLIRKGCYQMHRVCSGLRGNKGGLWLGFGTNDSRVAHLKLGIVKVHVFIQMCATLQFNKNMVMHIFHSLPLKRTTHARTNKCSALGSGVSFKMFHSSPATKNASSSDALTPQGPPLIRL